MARRRKCGETDSNRRLLSGYGGAAGWVESAMVWMVVDGRQAGGRKENESGLAVGARPPVLHLLEMEMQSRCCISSEM